MSVGIRTSGKAEGYSETCRRVVGLGVVTFIQIATASAMPRNDAPLKTGVLWAGQLLDGLGDRALSF